MESRFKLRISRMFRSSFGLCWSRNISDVVERPVFVPHNRQHFQLIDVCLPKPRPFPSICRPKPENVEDSCIGTKELLPRRKVSDRNTLLFSADTDGWKCPPASPISPLNTVYKFQEFESKPKEKKLRKKSNKKTHLRIKKGEKDPFGSFLTDNHNGWFSSDDEAKDDDETTLFSSKSLSSDSSDCLIGRNKTRYRHKTGTTRRRTAARKDSDASAVPLQGKVKDSFAVVKRSSDPYNDFRISMVEMIVEKQIFAARDLENMLECFLSLNSNHHHRVIIEVFTEILEALFSNWS